MTKLTAGAWLGLAWLGVDWLDLAWLGLAWLGLAGLGWAELRYFPTHPFGQTCCAPGTEWTHYLELGWMAARYCAERRMHEASHSHSIVQR